MNFLMIFFSKAESHSRFATISSRSKILLFGVVKIPLQKHTEQTQDKQKSHQLIEWLFSGCSQPYFPVRNVSRIGSGTAVSTQPRFGKGETTSVTWLSATLCVRLQKLHVCGCFVSAGRFIISKNLRKLNHILYKSKPLLQYPFPLRHTLHQEQAQKLPCTTICYSSEIPGRKTGNLGTWFRK